MRKRRVYLKTRNRPTSLTLESFDVGLDCTKHLKTPAFFGDFDPITLVERSESNLDSSKEPWMVGQFNFLPI